MRSHQLFEEIKKMDEKYPNFNDMVTIEVDGTRFENIEKHLLFDILYNKYEDLRCSDLSVAMRENNIKGYQLAEKLNITDVLFSKLLTGLYKSGKQFDNRLDFVQAAESAIKELCDK